MGETNNQITEWIVNENIYFYNSLKSVRKIRYGFGKFLERHIIFKYQKAWRINHYRATHGYRTVSSTIEIARNLKISMQQLASILVLE